MADKVAPYNAGGISYKMPWMRGRLDILDDFPRGDPRVGTAISSYGQFINANTNRQSHHWARALNWIENIIFGAGRHYIDGVLGTRLAVSSAAAQDLRLVRETMRNIPRPTNDHLGRYVETNIALLTENRPIPRVTPKSDRAEDITAAELSELTIEYLWEALIMPEKHREIARLLMYCGVAWMECWYDPTRVRRLQVPATTLQPANILIPGQTPIMTKAMRNVEQFDEYGRPIFKDQLEYGDIVSEVVSPFELHIPAVHWWNGEDMQWIMREKMITLDAFNAKYGSNIRNKQMTKANGWFMDRVPEIKGENVANLPLWWWERLAHLIEGPGPSLNVGTPEQWEDYVILRYFDRKPNEKWPRGRTVITAGDKVIYDSPKDIGARAYNPRWPERWHPYIRYRWEGMPGNIYGRSLVGKLLPKLKRVNSIDTTLIMWRRTVPVASWVLPKGTQVVEDLWAGGAGRIFEYDARRTGQKAPEPVYPPPFPAAALEERQMQMQEMDMIAGTEEILRGQRPVGVNSAAMIDILRKQALASRSAILQAWDESLQELASVMLQITIANVQNDPRYLERLRILAREKNSRLSISTFSGMALSDNVQVRVDTASMALVSKEAREAKALEVMQYAPGLMALPVPLRQALVEELGWEKALQPQGSDVQRAKRFISFIHSRQFQYLIPMPEDDPYIFSELLIEELKSDVIRDFDPQQLGALVGLVNIYKQQIQLREEQAMRVQMMMAATAQGGSPAMTTGELGATAQLQQGGGGQVRATAPRRVPGRVAPPQGALGG